MGCARLYVIAVGLAGCRAVFGLDTPEPARADTAVGQDASPTDAPPDAQTSFLFEAEAYDSMTSPQAPYWEVRATVSDYFGTGYIVGVPDNMVNCDVSSGNCASVVFKFAVTIPAEYFIHVRTNCDNSDADSFWYGFDGVAAATYVDVPDSVPWNWVSTPSDALLAGNHTLEIWMREDGLRIDALAVTTSPSPP